MEIPKIFRLSDCNVKTSPGKISIIDPHLHQLRRVVLYLNRLAFRVVDIPDVRALDGFAQHLFILPAHGKGIFNRGVSVCLRHVFHVINRDRADSVKIKALFRIRLRRGRS